MGETVLPSTLFYYCFLSSSDLSFCFVIFTEFGTLSPLLPKKKSPGVHGFYFWTKIKYKREEMKSNTSGGYWCRLSFEVAAFFLILVNICTGVEVQLIPSTEESTCDVQYATLGTTQCQYAHIRVAYLDLLANLTNVMVDIDKTNQLVRRMYIDVHVHTHLDENTEVHTDPLTNSTEITIDTQKIDEYIDSFLTPRPWWIVGHEGVTQTHTSPTQSHTTQKFSYHIYLLRSEMIHRV